MSDVTKRALAVIDTLAELECWAALIGAMRAIPVHMHELDAILDVARAALAVAADSGEHLQLSGDHHAKPIRSIVPRGRIVSDDVMDELDAAIAALAEHAQPVDNSPSESA